MFAIEQRSRLTGEPKPSITRAVDSAGLMRAHFVQLVLKQSGLPEGEMHMEGRTHPDGRKLVTVVFPATKDRDAFNEIDQKAQDAEAQHRHSPLTGQVAALSRAQEVAYEIVERRKFSSLLPYPR